jgi:putative DNA primase/helicase
LPEADCPRWTTFLDEVLPDRSKQAVLAEYFAYVFVRQFTLEKTLLLYGTGANGKSVVFRVINAMLGEENVTNYGLEALCNDYYRAKIANSLLNYSSDISNRLQAEKFKLITSGEPIEARLPYGQPMILKRYARLAFNCNELPKDVEHTEAYFRRFLIIHFDQFIPEENRNPTLASEIIDTELPGVFNWVLQGLDRLLASKAFSPCAAAQESLKWYKTESDSVAMFLADEGYGRSETSQPVKGVYRDYREYCGDNGYRPLGRNNFGKRLQHIGIPILRTRLGLEAHLARDLFSGDNVTTSPGHATGWSL